MFSRHQGACQRESSRAGVAVTTVVRNFLGVTIMLKTLFTCPPLVVLLVTFFVLPARAVEAFAPRYKFTVGYYTQAGAGQATVTGLDFNLRRSFDDANVWIAWFQSAGMDLRQSRAGWDQVFSFGPIRVQPSLQAASDGFWGGSLAAETGDTWFAGVGLGRTNLHPYVNLNFDPNDAWMLSGGHRWTKEHSLSLQVVQDNRQNPDQRHIHLVYRRPLGPSDRLTIDLLDKRGTVERSHIHRAGLSIAYDWPHLFIRLSYDPRVNFSSQNMWRAQVGTYF